MGGEPPPISQSSSGLSTSGISSASPASCELVVSDPGSPPKVRPSDPKSATEPPSWPISSSACSSASRSYASRTIGSAGAISICRYRFRPVAAGISFPMITFSFSPSRRSIFPSIEASVSTLVVSWKDAAERNDSVASDAFVMPRMSGS